MVPGMFKSLSAKILAMIIGFLLLGLGLFTVFLTRGLEHYLHRQLSLEIGALGGSLAQTFVDPLLAEDYPVLQNTVAQLVQSDARLVKGQILREQKIIAETVESGAHLESHSIRHEEPIKARDVQGKAKWQVGTLVLWASTEAAEHTIHRVQAVVVGGALICFFILALSLGQAVKRMAIEPLTTLTAQTRRIAKGDYAFQLPVSSQDEIGALITAFNHMVRELEARGTRIAEQNKLLVHSEKMAAYGQISAGITHEVKTPLANILGYAQLAKKKIAAEPNHPVARYLESIEKETQRSHEIIEHLTKFTRQDPVPFVLLDIHQVIRDALKLTQHHLTSGKIQVSFDSKEDPTFPKVKGNINQLEQVLMNIIRNAQQAMPQGGALTISTDVKDAWVVVKIQDTGVGISAENLTRVFEPFFTTRLNQRAMGLGLTVAYGIIEEHGGKITVESVEKQGATFTIALPLAAG